MRIRNSLSLLRFILLPLALWLVVLSCSRKDERIIYVDGAGVETEHITPVRNIDGVVQSSSTINCFRDHLFIVNNGTVPEGQLIVYSLADGSSQEYFKRGRGPGEMLGLYDCTFLDGGTKIALLDVVAKKIWVVPSDSILKGTFKPVEATTIDSPDGIIVLNIAGGIDRIYSTGTVQGKRIITFGLDGTITFDGIYSPDVNEKEPNEFVNQAYMGNTAYNDWHHSVVIANRYADQIEIYNIETKAVRFIKGPDVFEPKYRIVKTSSGSALAHEQDEQLGYVCARVKDKAIYVLFSGKTNRQRGASYGHEIRVFDWNGHLKRIIDLGQDVLSFDVSNDGKSLFASIDDRILEYSI